MLSEAGEMKLRPWFWVRRLCVTTCISGLLFAAPMQAQDKPLQDRQTQDNQEKLDVDDVSRSFIVHLPKGYDSQQHYPVVILLAGRNQDAEDMARLTHFNQLADKNGIIAVYPIAVHGRWNIGVRPEQPAAAAPHRGGYGHHGGMGGGGYPGGGGGYPGGGGGGYPGGGQGGGQTSDDSRNRPEAPDDVAFLGQMLDQLATKYSVDAHRIYATGLGDGGFMALRAGCALADRVAAIAPVGAGLPKTMICLPSRAVPALFVSGTEDPIVPYGGGTYKPGQFHVLSAEDSAKTWARFDRCNEKPAQDKLPALQQSGKETKTFTFSGCQDGGQVLLYAVKGGGNTWPGGEQYMSEKEVGKTSDALNANESIWNFLATKKIAGESGGGK
jgi:polyhydroxybutyrate depolymerase